MFKFTDYKTPLPVVRVDGATVARKMRGDLEEAAAVLVHLAVPPDNGFAEDVAGYVPVALRGATAEYLELIAKKIREEMD